MSRIGFIGLGVMGMPMATRLVKAGHEVCGFDLSASATEEFARRGGRAGGSIADVMSHADTVFTMLPTGPIVIDLYNAADGVLVHAHGEHVLIDCSTIGVPSARTLHGLAHGRGIRMIDAPVTGGVDGAEAGTLTIMVGGIEDVFERVKSLLACVGQRLLYVGKGGAGQAAKVCNNMVAGINKIAISEAFVLARKLGVDDKVFFDIASAGSANSFALTRACPVPGLVPTAPSSRDYNNGFATKLMLKDMVLAQEAAMEAGVATPLGAASTQLYRLCADAGHADKDNAIIYKFLAGNT
jgi:3-hydroxyisobutyrate dehydrogenase